MNIQLAVFDMAGTTVNDGDAVNRCFRAALAARGLDVQPEKVNAVMGMAKPEAIRRLIEESHLAFQLQDKIDEIHADFAKRMKSHYESDPSVQEIEGTAMTFAILRKAGVKVAVNSGFSRDICTVLLRRLRWLGPPPLIDASVASDEVPRGRPHPDMIRLLMKRFGLHDPVGVAKIGDTPVDLAEGTNAGCGLVVGVTSGTHTREELERHPHTHLVRSVADVPDLILH
jgi:phosphonatase-like hydrolase